MEAYTNHFLARKRRSLIVLGLIFSFIIGFELGVQAGINRPLLNPENFKIKGDTSLPIEPAAIECSKRQGMPCA